jgi:hypothetical protein
MDIGLAFCYRVGLKYLEARGSCIKRFHYALKTDNQYHHLPRERKGDPTAT